MESDRPAYRLDELGWLQFERLAELVLEREARLTELTWHGHADVGRVALADDVLLERPRVPLPGPVAVAVVWVRADPALASRLLFAGVSAVKYELGFWFDHVLVVTNVDATQAERALAQRFGEVKRFVVLGAEEISQSLDRHPALRAAMPSVLGLRDLEPLIATDARERSSLDIDAAQELARVFWATRAYERARAVLSRHRFVVLTGPPEMGKTAIARMLALAQLSDGWDAYECTTPEQVWTALDGARPQVFVADDAFGSTEYRPDAAELWARELGRMLRSLDDRHWLIWTSRPAPLKAGLRRVHRERGSEHFPAPGEVLVDAGELDLAEKTMILFRHAKRRDDPVGRRRRRHAAQEARRLVRSAGISIVEHPHFTPERIRRFVAERLDELTFDGSLTQLLRTVEHELARPTEAMETSFEALEAEHRELLIALLDAPAGLIDERELAATVRRHHAGGLRRPAGELVDRLTDHFLRVTPLGIGWVHPSWRDLVIGQLQDSAEARRRFLSACGIHGVLLALSREGGAAGERSLPLLLEDRDWDALGDRLAGLLRELEDLDTVRLFVALGEDMRAGLEPAAYAEVQSLASYVLGTTRRVWEKQQQSVPVFVLEGWYSLNGALPDGVEPPPVARTWAELRPSRSVLLGQLGCNELRALDEWLALAQLLALFDPDALAGLGFYERDQQLVGHAEIEAAGVTDPELRPLAGSVLRRIRELSPSYADAASAALTRFELAPRDERWWVPTDLAAPPSTEPVVHEQAGFTRDDVKRVLSDL